MTLILQEKVFLFSIYLHKIFYTLDYELQKYKIGVYKDNKLKKVISLKITNNEELKTLSSFVAENKENIVSKAIQNTRLETIVEDNSVTLQWTELPDEDRIYEIYRDDQKIGETSELSYIDTNVKPNTEYRYTLKVDNVLSNEAKKEADEKAKEINETLKEEDYIYSGFVSTLIITPDNSEESLITDEIMAPLVENVKEAEFTKAAVPKSNEFYLDYRTFIPYKSVENPNFLSSHKYLKGDNRTSFSANSNAFRTESSVFAKFTNNPTLKLTPDVNGTYSCSKSDCSDAKYVDTASTSGIQLSKLREEKNNLRWTVNHSVPIPLPGPYPVIDYYYLAILTPSSLSISGEHDEAPNHEFYLNYSTGNKKIHTFSVSSKNDFWKLMGKQTTWSFDM